MQRVTMLRDEFARNRPAAAKLPRISVAARTGTDAAAAKRRALEAARALAEAISQADEAALETALNKANDAGVMNSTVEEAEEALRRLVSLRELKVAANGDDDSVLQASIFLAKQSGVSEADIAEAEATFNQRLKAFGFEPAMPSALVPGHGPVAVLGLQARAELRAPRAARAPRRAVSRGRFWRAAGAVGSAAVAAGAARVARAEVKVVQGIRRKKLGSSDILVSEMGLGTQRWGSTDFNAPDESLCHQMMDRAILEGGVNLVDTAEQYPIPSDAVRPEGLTEEIIGRWLAKDKSRRKELVIATKITGGLNVNAQNIREDLEASLKRLKTDYVDVYLTHWSFRLSQPQQNWGQSLQYRQNFERIARREGQASFEEVVKAMDKLVKEGKIRGWGCCNESVYGATRLVATAKALGATPPCAFQNDYSMLNRRCEENGLFEMCSPYNEDVGFMGYNVLAGGMLTGKYLEVPAAPDEPNPVARLARTAAPRGRMDDLSWGPTLYRYRSAAAKDATRRYAQLAKEAGLPLTDLALRWARQRPGMTTALVGHTSLAQLEEDLKAMSAQEPLSQELMWEIDRVHLRNRLPIFANEDTQGLDPNEGEIGEPIP
ncbi:unnamed protein product [Effrenium voratum]|nr:unnamed protein product [Effrenium voratum]